MKKIATILFLCLAFHVNAQHTAKEIFKSDNMVWYGLDFSQARFIGQFEEGFGMGIKTADDLKINYFSHWNMVILNEPNKYQLKKVFRKSNTFYDIDVVAKRNMAVESDKVFTFNPYTFDNPSSLIKSMIADYEAGAKADGIGLVFIVEYFDKINNQAAVYVTFFDIATKQVLISERITGKPKGIGLRNFWAGAIHHMLLQIDKTEYSKWKSKY